MEHSPQNSITQYCKYHFYRYIWNLSCTCIDRTHYLLSIHVLPYRYITTLRSRFKPILELLPNSIIDHSMDLHFLNHRNDRRIHCFSSYMGCFGRYIESNSLSLLCYSCIYTGDIFRHQTERIA